jgi:hypothetical protein
MENKPIFVVEGHGKCLESGFHTPEGEARIRAYIAGHADWLQDEDEDEEEDEEEAAAEAAREAACEARRALWQEADAARRTLFDAAMRLGAAETVAEAHAHVGAVRDAARAYAALERQIVRPRGVEEAAA